MSYLPSVDVFAISSEPQMAKWDSQIHKSKFDFWTSKITIFPTPQDATGDTSTV